MEDRAEDAFAPRELRTRLAYELWRSRDDHTIRDAAFMFGVTPDEVMEEFAAREPKSFRRVEKTATLGLTLGLLLAGVLNPILRLWQDVHGWVGSLLGVRR